MKLGSVYAEIQKFENLYNVEESLFHGTVFKDLYERYKYDESEKKPIKIKKVGY